MLSQLLERELDKCQRLVAAIPMDMTAFYGKNTYLEQSREMLLILARHIWRLQT